MDATHDAQSADGDLKTELSPDNRSKCQLCKQKIAKFCWRFRLACKEEFSNSGRIVWQSAHASCFLHNVTDGDPTQNTSQSMPFYSGMPSSKWNNAPLISFRGASSSGTSTFDEQREEAVKAAIAGSDPNEDLSLDQLLPTSELRECLSAAVESSVPGSQELEANHKIVLELFCFYGKLTPQSEALLDSLETAEGSLHGTDYESKDPLKAKFTQYSPNSQAHCRDCQCRLEQGDVRVGANVFSNSSRHAGYSVNYWCLDCMCKRPATRRAARLYPNELEKVLPGAELLVQADVERVCALLKISPPTQEMVASLAQGRKRQTRSGRKFGTWGEGAEVTDQLDPTSSSSSSSSSSASKKSRR